MCVCVFNAVQSCEFAEVNDECLPVRVLLVLWWVGWLVGGVVCFSSS